MNRLSREERMLQTKAALEREEASVQALLFSRKRHKNFGDVILLLYKGEKLTEYHNDPRIALIGKCFEELSSPRFAKEKKLLKDVLVDVAVPRGLIGGTDYVHVLCNIAGARKFWINDIYQWKPVARQKYLQLGELIEFLFCKYPVPDFLYKAFDSNGNKLFVKWLIHLGQGGKLRDLENIPVPLTNKGRHYFMQAPGKLSVAEALRWAQVKSLNGDDKLANRIASSWLGTKPYEEEEFWYEFLRKVVNGGMFDVEELPALIDYVRDEKRNNTSYSLKGRTLQSLLRQSEEWHNRFSVRSGYREWKSSGIGGYTVNRDGTMIELEELTESRGIDTGKQNYEALCSIVCFLLCRRKVSHFLDASLLGWVWLETLATIEVNLYSKKIVQAKGKMNRKISDAAKKHMHAWAAKERLAISEYL